MAGEKPEVFPASSRRDVLKAGSAAIAGAAAMPSLSSAVYASGSDVLKIGLVGCGLRGSSAALQALTADPHSRLVAAGDVFRDQLNRSLNHLGRHAAVGDRVVVDEDHRFVGFDAYRHVIDASDVVLLATTPHFRPMHLKAAIEAGRHVFCEKPVAVDAPGVRSCLESTQLAAEKGLSLVSGLCWRYHAGVRATFEQLHAGTAGKITAMQCSYNSNGVWEPRRTREQCGSEMEYQLRNWYYYTWLSGDFNVEQHVHSLDKMAWAMRDTAPVRVSGSGGRQQRTDAKYGNIYDHFNVVYEYENGVRAFARCRHWKASTADTSDHIYCTNGHVDVLNHRIDGWDGTELWKFDGKSKSMHQVEHDELFVGIRLGSPINNGHYMSLSTMMAIAGRIVAYTGQTLDWQQLINSTEDLSPPVYDWVDIPVPEIAIPGETRFV